MSGEERADREHHDQSTPTIVSSDVMSWVRLCWSDWPMLSMSFVTRLRTSPRGWLSK